MTDPGIKSMPTRQVVADALRRIGLPHRAVRKLLAAGWKAIDEAEQVEAERKEAEEARRIEDEGLARDLEQMARRLKDRK